MPENTLRGIEVPPVSEWDKGTKAGVFGGAGALGVAAVALTWFCCKRLKNRKASETVLTQSLRTGESSTTVRLLPDQTGAGQVLNAALSGQAAEYTRGY